MYNCNSLQGVQISTEMEVYSWNVIAYWVSNIWQKLSNEVTFATLNGEGNANIDIYVRVNTFVWVFCLSILKN